VTTRPDLTQLQLSFLWPHEIQAFAVVLILPTCTLPRQLSLWRISSREQQDGCTLKLRQIIWWIRGSSVSMVTRLRAGRPGLISRYREEVFLFATVVFNIGSGANPVSYPVGTRTPSPGVKWPGRKADHSRPSSADVKNAWSYTSTLPYVIMARCLVKYRGNFALM
jgi:hypothetical protein